MDITAGFQIAEITHHAADDIALNELHHRFIDMVRRRGGSTLDYPKTDSLQCHRMDEGLETTAGFLEKRSAI
jgi:hypothetical protein